jgi:hypothetical protein
MKEVSANFEGKIFDGFFSEPIKFRKAIKTLDFVPPNPGGRGGVAWYCRVPTNDEIKEKLEKIWGFKITTIYSEYRYSFKKADESRRAKGAQIVCHSDYGTSEYTSVVYLTAPKYCNGGTNFFMHLPSGAKEFVPKGGMPDFLDHSAWRPYFSSKMAFNRVVTYRSSLFHAVKPPFFGSNLNDCRLILTTRFDRVY